MGPLVSPVTAACGRLVQCGGGLVGPLELENEAGQCLRGTALSEQVWTGRRFSDA